MIVNQPSTVRSAERAWARTAGSTGHVRDNAALWVFAPHFLGNPYQELLSMGLPDYGIAAIGTPSIDEAISLISSAKTSIPRVLHLHWLNVVLDGAATHDEAKRRVERFAAQLDAVRSKGIQIAWTMHNVLPHESVYEDLEIAVREAIISRADLIHVMSPDSAELCAPYFTLDPDKVVRVEHPGYQGYYPGWLTRSAARRALGFSDHEHVALILGAIKPYKGLLDLAEDIDALSRSHPRRVSVLIAGQPGRDTETRALLDLAQVHPAIHVIPDRVPAERVGNLFAAADSALIPYRASLNSGALVLSLSTGTPVIARATAGSTHLLATGAGRIYNSREQLHDALLNSEWLPHARMEAQRMADRLRPHHIAHVFGRMAGAFLDGGLPAARAAVGADGGLDD